MKRLRINWWFPHLRTLVRQLGPYAAIELLLPGGSVLAALLWLYRHRERLATASVFTRMKERSI
jgi:hypothetical protein